MATVLMKIKNRGSHDNAHHFGKSSRSPREKFRRPCPYRLLRRGGSSAAHSRCRRDARSFRFRQWIRCPGCLRPGRDPVSHLLGRLHGDEPACRRDGRLLHLHHPGHRQAGRCWWCADGASDLFVGTDRHLRVVRRLHERRRGIDRDASVVGLVLCRTGGRPSLRPAKHCLFRHDPWHLHAG